MIFTLCKLKLFILFMRTGSTLKLTLSEQSAKKGGVISGAAAVVR